jgi:Uma2 family endonuclease
MSATIETTPKPRRVDAVGEPASPWGRVHRLSVEQYHAMIAAGILVHGDPIELLDGLLVTKMTRHPPHVVAASLLFAAFYRALPAGWHACKEDPITLPPASEPEPDLTVVRGEIRDYAVRNPGPADVALVVEVSDSTLAFDRGFKLRLYARAGLPVYWILDVVEGVVEVHTDPTGPAPEPSYRRREVVGRDGELTLDLGGPGPVRLAVRDLLP